MGLIIEKEMVMRAKQSHMSLSFSILITELCQRVGVLRDEMRYIKVTPTFSTDIQRIEAEYTQEEAYRRRATPVDASLEIEVETILAQAPLPPASGPSDVRAIQLDAMVPWMIESDILAALTPIRASIDTLTVRVETADVVDALTTFEIPPATTGDVQIDDIVADESEAETDEEQIEVPEETIYGDLLDLEEMIVQSMIQTSLTETSMVGPR
uniref:Polyprotein protein n=1 Tax=Solanum tuberosum TaxID=4113 RepID=M1DDJ2_SOLTU